MITSPIDIIALAKAAHARGLNAPSGVAAHLERLIERNTAYLERRRRNGQSGRLISRWPMITRRSPSPLFT